MLGIEDQLKWINSGDNNVHLMRPLEDELVNIFQEKAEEIREQLTNGSQELNILSIVGMPGIGKTTLADSVFQHSSVARHFHVQARCTVSQVNNKERLMREILKQLTGGSNQFHDDELEEKLYKNLKGRRYLILMDDIWDIQLWMDIRNSFPDDGKGSRIMFTSRFGEIASQVGLENINYRLSPLSEDKSWEMLKVKLFGKDCCPPELERLGREIAANCKGLPLSIDLIAGVLRVSEAKDWEKVAIESIPTLLLDDPQGHCGKVLELSYQNLPDELKPCFLYFSAFPEDADVLTRRLILLWISEGFIHLKEDDPRRLEDAAQDVLNNLITRSLVIVSKRKPLRGVKASRVHDLLHEFATKKVQEDGFMLKQVVLDGETILSTVSTGSRLRTLICCSADYWEGFQNNVKWDFRDFKLLRVLDITKSNLQYCSTMLNLIHLRFLAISSSAKKIITKIHKLRNLETLMVDYGRGIHYYFIESLLVDKIFNMLRLRHLYFGGYISFRYRTRKILEKSMFNNLQTLKSLQASYEDDIGEILKLMPNLVELKVLFYNPDGECYPFPKLDFLEKLESLSVAHRFYDLPYPCKITSFPPYLKKLVLKNFLVPWTEISDIGNFEYLEVLKLKSGAFQGPIWDMIDGQFPKLKYLCLSNLEIQEWGASEDHLLCLEQLRVEHCTLLEELPSCLADISKLKGIKLSDCSSSAKNSAMRIKEEQEELRNDQLIVYMD